MKLKNKVLDLFLWHPILVLALGTLGFVGKAAAPLVEQLDSCAGRGRGSLLFFFFLLSLVLWAIHYKQEL
jgi:hypothetical protein